MKKKKYSMTAKQRKELREKQDRILKDPKPEEREEAEAILAERADKKKRLKRVLTVSVVCVVAAALIATGIAVPIAVLCKPQSKIDGNPIATIKLSDGRSLKMELFYDQAPGAVSNFMYLCWNGYFDDTIFHDATNGFIGFAGFTSPTEIRATDVGYVKRLKGFSDHNINVSGQDKFKLGYRIKRENTTANVNEKGLMIFLSASGTYGTSTHFMFTANSNPQLTFSGTSISISSNITVMGRWADERTLGIIDSIYAMDKVDKGEFNVWRHPVNYNDIRIESVKIVNIGYDVKTKIKKSFESVINDGEDKLTMSWSTRPFTYTTSVI